MPLHYLSFPERVKLARSLVLNYPDQSQAVDYARRHGIPLLLEPDDKVGNLWLHIVSAVSVEGVDTIALLQEFASSGAATSGRQVVDAKDEIIKSPVVGVTPPNSSNRGDRRELLAFLSYASVDNSSPELFITHLRSSLELEYLKLTGAKLKIFMDTGISKGMRWEEQISHAIADSRMFILVLTPNYLHSSFCRRELFEFAKTHPERPIVPVHYIDVEKMSDNRELSKNRARAMIGRYQWDDWRQLRLVSFRNKKVREQVTQLARTISELAKQVD